jgi:hypothetical protein
MLARPTASAVGRFRFPARVRNGRKIRSKIKIRKTIKSTIKSKIRT